MPWAHAIGVYLLAGVLFMGIGQLLRKRLEESGQIKKLKFTKAWHHWVASISIVLATVLWPIVLLIIYIARQRNLGKTTRFLGYCEHATVFQPICSECRRETEKKNASAAARLVLGKSSCRIPIGEIMKSCYICSACGVEREGFPPAATPEGKPLCRSCIKIE